MPFLPDLDRLPEAQRALWPELAATPESFTLYGGTALALRLGHRASVDFDFFSNVSFDPERLAEQTAYLSSYALSRLWTLQSCRCSRLMPELGHEAPA
jgi:hypothetical protein